MSRVLETLDRCKWYMRTPKDWSRPQAQRCPGVVPRETGVYTYPLTALCVLYVKNQVIHSTTMARLYTHTPLAICLSLLFLIQSLVSAHMIEVAAGKKECFFEDLHVNDKVYLHILFGQNRILKSLKMTVTYQVGGGGHLDVDFWVSHSHWCSYEKSDVRAACRSKGTRLGKAHQTEHRHRVDHREKRWHAWILFFKPDEYYDWQACQVRTAVLHLRNLILIGHIASTSMVSFTSMTMASVIGASHERITN